MDDNEAIFKPIFEDEEFQGAMKDFYAHTKKVYGRARDVTDG